MTNSIIKPPLWFWIVSVIALIWNAMGVYQYLIAAYNTESFRAAYSEEELEIILNQPVWYTAVFAVAVFAGILGAIFLLIRKKVAVPTLIISAIAVVIQMGYLLLVIKVGDAVMPTFVIIFSVFLVWFSRTASTKGWIS